MVNYRLHNAKLLWCVCQLSQCCHLIVKAAHLKGFQIGRCHLFHPVLLITRKHKQLNGNRAVLYIVVIMHPKHIAMVPVGVEWVWLVVL